jgi:superfamily II DNA or RNA helicase
MPSLMTGFKTRRESTRPPESPQALFRQLRPRNRNIRDLLSRQADVLRAYAKLPTGTRDVAVELPTGAGKTLVGLLLAEYRRLAEREPVAYLCPTVQLARQAAAKANEYGLTVSALTGPSADWDPADRNSYVRGRSVAVTNVSDLSAPAVR